MPFATKEAKAKYMSEWKKRRAQTSEVSDVSDVDM